MKKVNVLGTEYTIRKGKRDDPKLSGSDGYFEPYSKEIVIDTFEVDSQTINNLEEYEKKVIRHKLIHAFLEESGLAQNSQFGRNEELVDWIAIQFPKIQEAFGKAGVL